jgi:hypothetical protein
LAGVGVDTAPQTIAVAIPHANRALWKRVIIRSPRPQTIPAAGLKVSFSHGSRSSTDSHSGAGGRPRRTSTSSGPARARAQQHRRACACEVACSSKGAASTPNIVVAVAPKSRQTLAST